MKKVLSIILAAAMTVLLAGALTACGSKSSNENTANTVAPTMQASDTADGAVYKIGLCNYVDDASLNQIVENIQDTLAEIGAAEGVTFEITYQNCNADANVLNQIIADFEADQVDLMIGIATPVALAMQAATEDSGTPVVFAAVSDPLSCGLVQSLEAPGANVTGTSDYLDTEAILNLMVTANPDIKSVGLLYDLGQDSSTTPIKEAKAFLDEAGIKYQEYTGTNSQEVDLAVQSLVADDVDAVFTPSDNTIMNCELSICEKMAEAGILHYAGADSFALNGAFLGYGVDYANLGVETADMVADILLNNADITKEPVRTFDNGIATINTDVCDVLGIDVDKITKAFEPFCTKVQTIQTAASFSDVED